MGVLSHSALVLSYLIWVNEMNKILLPILVTREHPVPPSEPPVDPPPEDPPPPRDPVKGFDFSPRRGRAGTVAALHGSGWKPGTRFRIYCKYAGIITANGSFRINRTVAVKAPIGHNSVSLRVIDQDGRPRNPLRVFVESCDNTILDKQT